MFFAYFSCVMLCLILGWWGYLGGYKNSDNYESVKKEGLEQIEGYKTLDKVKSIPKLRSFLLLGSKNGVEFLEVF
ncbi:MAG: hypothetical protein Q9M39_01990 [Sulfurovum sp.]|nr:hypothetical protein [Sulfurovum sp.]